MALKGPAPRKALAGLYGMIRKPMIVGAPLAQVSPLTIGPPRPGARRFVFASRTLSSSPEGRLAVPIDVYGSQMDEEAAALRHWGDPEHTVAGYRRRAPPGEARFRAIGALALVDAAGGGDGPFDLAAFEVTRQQERWPDKRTEKERVATRLRAYPPTKEWSVATSSGAMVVGAPSEAGPSDAGPAPIEAEAFDEIKDGRVNERILAGLRLRLRLLEAATALPERQREGEPGGGAPARHSARLRFHEAEALFYAPALEGEPASATDGLVPIGPMGARAASARFSLDRARLSVQRPHDLLSLDFRFSGLVLDVPWRSNGEAALGPPGLFSACRMPAQQPPIAQHPLRDVRPMMVVEFPPQHVLEQPASFKPCRRPTCPSCRRRSAGRKASARQSPMHCRS